MKISGISFASLKTKPKILIGICSPLILLMGLGATSIFSIDTIVETNEWVDHTRVVLGDSVAIVGSAVDMETGMRGYLLAGEDGFLDPYRSGEEATYSGLAALRETVSDNPAQIRAPESGRGDAARVAGERHRADHRAASRNRRCQDHERHGGPGRRSAGQGLF